MAGSVAARQSALLVLVPEAEPVLAPWREHFSPAEWGIPAHITLIVPFLEPDSIDARVVADLRALFAAVPPFRFTLAAVRRFANLPAAPDVVYLGPEPAGPFVELIARLTARYPEAPPYGGAYDTVIPHLTILVSDDRALLDAATQAAAGALPIAARADQVWLMEQSAERPEVWQPRHRFSLGPLAPLGATG